MRPAVCVLRWDGGSLEFAESGVCGALAASLVREGDVLRLRAEARRPLRLLEISVRFDADYPAGCRVFLNGYQSWTDSRERAPDARMDGLRRAPGFLVRKFGLDGYGDARFTRYDYGPGRLHGFGYAYARSGERLELLGSLSEANGFTTLRMDTARGALTAEKECPRRPIEGQTELMALYCGAGTEAQVFDGWFAAMGVRPLPAPRITGYTSWYRHYQNISEETLMADLRDLRGMDVFQIDDGFEPHVGDWLEPRRDRFPNGLAPLAAEIRARGMIPGLWLAPFVCEADSELCRTHPDWLLRDSDGVPVNAGGNWSGIRALDTENPEARAYVAAVFGAVRSWGFRLVKLDFLYAACILPHGGKTRGQLMCEAMDFLRACAGDLTLLACGVPLLPAFGKAEYCRVGCDVGLDWDDKPWMRLLHRERVSTRRSLQNTVGRRQLDGRAFGNDPDVLLLRRDVRLTAEQRKALLMADALCGSVLFTSDDVPAYSETERAEYDRALELFRRGRLISAETTESGVRLRCLLADPK